MSLKFSASNNCIEFISTDNNFILNINVKSTIIFYTDCKSRLQEYVIVRICRLQEYVKIN